MSARHFHFSLIGGGAQDRPKAEFDAMRIGRTTWIGLTLAVIGWAMLLGEMGLADFLRVENPRLLPPTFHDDFVDVAKTLIYSGFGLALVGSLQTGFGALNRFFEAVLVRSGQRTQTASLPVPPVTEAYKRDEPFKREEPYKREETYKRDESFKRDEPFKREDIVYKREEVAPAAKPVRGGRPYKTFADGSVEVETILGNRRFRSMKEAQDFI